MKIAIPDHPLYAPILGNVDDVCQRLGWTLIRASEPECSRLLLANMVDMALVSPIGYGMGVALVDYRIIAGPCVQLHDYTDIVGMSFTEHLTGIDSVSSPTPKDFLVRIGALVLAEKFDVEVPALSQGTGDCTIAYVGEADHPAMDVSEEWYDLTEEALVAGLWVCRVEADVDTVEDAVRLIAGSPPAERQISERVPAEGDHFPREGRITYVWDEDTEEALETTMQMLFFHQIFTDLPAVKLFGRDPWGESSES